MKTCEPVMEAMGGSRGSVIVLLLATKYFMLHSILYRSKGFTLSDSRNAYIPVRMVKVISYFGVAHACTPPAIPEP